MFRPVTPAVIKVTLTDFRKLEINPATGRYTVVVCTSAEKATARAVVLSLGKTFVESNANIQTNSVFEALVNARCFVPAGTIFKRPPNLVTVKTVKDGISNADFHARSRRGEIVVSDYERASIMVRQTAGLRTSKRTYSDIEVTPKTLIAHGMLSKTVINGATYMFVPGTSYLLWTTDDRGIFTYQREYFDTFKWEYHSLVSAGSILSACRSYNPDFTALVTNTLAKANRSSVDVLTAAAEMPKSVLSLIQGIKLVVNILRDAKKGQFSLSKAHEAKKKRLNARHLKRVQRLQDEILSRKTSESRRKALQKHLNEIRIKNRTTLLKLADELASESASLWLNYRYNIMPNVYLAQDVFDAVTKFHNEFITARGRQNSSLSIPAGDHRIDVDCALRCMIKRSFSPAAISKGQSVISNDIFVTAWELVPLSFVYDWFINIGDLLSSQVYSHRWAQEGATKSVQLDLDLDFPISDDIDWSIEPTTSVEGSYYRRTVIDPTDECGLVWQPTLGLERQIDAVALIWRPVRSLLLKGKQR